MYATINDVIKILPPTISVGDTNLGTPVPGGVSDRSKLTTNDIIKYLAYAHQEIDARLRPMYVCPLRRIKIYEEEILQDISAGNNIVVTVHDSSQFIKGQVVRLQDKLKYEEASIANIADMTTVTIATVVNSYTVDNVGRIGILQFPDPIPLIAARLAVSYGFDQLFSAEQAPNISEYGKEQRKLAMNGLENILTGNISLFGQELTGRRFLRGTLYDGYKSPTADFQFGRESS